jgi:hypothetical protein
VQPGGERQRFGGFEVFPVVCPPPFRGGRSWLFVRLDAGNGTRGYGEMTLLGAGFRLPVLAAMVAEDVARRHAPQPSTIRSY